MKKIKEIKGIFYSQTDIGKVRIENEDQALALVNSSGNVILGVFDGMGGQNKGDYASRMAKRVVEDEFKKRKAFSNVYQARYWLAHTIKKANNAIYSEAFKNPLYKDMGTTLVVALLIGEDILIANIGDSRAYLVRYGSLKQLTEDQTYVDYLYRTGKIKKEEMKTRSDRHVLMNALGVFPSISFDITTVGNVGCPILLCSDGLYNNASEEEIHAVLKLDDRVEQKIETLISIANANGGSDNIAIAYWEALENYGENR